MSQSGFSKISRFISSKFIDLMVKPKLLGEVPPTPSEQEAIQTPTPLPESDSQITTEPASIATSTGDENTNKYTIYVLQTYSHSNAVLLDNETQRLHLPRALQPIQANEFSEKNAVFFLHKQPTNHNLISQEALFPPRLLRLIQIIQQYQHIEIDLVPVTILWGREPDKEDSLFKLLFSDAWSTPSKTKQLFNIGVYGRQTFIEFHQALSLRQLVDYAQEHTPNLSPATYVIGKLVQQLNNKREAILGPDLSDRRTVMQSLIKSRDVQEAIQQESIRSKISTDEAEQRAIAHLNEIISDYSYSTVRFAESILTRLWTQLYDGVEVNHFNTVRDLAEKYEIVYVPCHRSHIDYLLLSYIIFQKGLRVPYIAAGDNLNLPVIGQFLRGGGAFFIRRSFHGAQLYTSVFREYLYSIVSRNTPLEYFIEGGRSRTGRLLMPKTGLLAMTIHGHLRGQSKPIAFIPTYIGYERLMEGATYINELKGNPKEAESIWGLLKTMRKIDRIFGQVHLNFGEPIFLDDVFAQQKVTKPSLTSNKDPLAPEVSQTISVAACQIMTNINRAATISPISLLALVLLAAPQFQLEESLCLQNIEIYKKISTLLPYDERIKISALSAEEMIEYAIKLQFIQRDTIDQQQIIRVIAGQAGLLSYFRNNILHLFIMPALITQLAKNHGWIKFEDLSQTIKAVYPFIQAEFFLKWTLDELDTVIRQYCDIFIAEKILINREHMLACPIDEHQEYHQLIMLGQPVHLTIKRYFMILALIQQRGSGHISTRQIDDLAKLLHRRLADLQPQTSTLSSDEYLPDFYDDSLIKTFYKTMLKQDIIENNSDGQIELTHSFQSLFKTMQSFLEAQDIAALMQNTKFDDTELQHALHLARKQKPERRKTK